MFLCLRRTIYYRQGFGSSGTKKEGQATIKSANDSRRRRTLQTIFIYIIFVNKCKIKPALFRKYRVIELGIDTSSRFIGNILTLQP